MSDTVCPLSRLWQGERESAERLRWRTHPETDTRTPWYEVRLVAPAVVTSAGSPWGAVVNTFTLPNPLVTPCQEDVSP